MDGELRLPRLRQNRPVPRGLEAGLEWFAGTWMRWRARRTDLVGEAERVLALMAEHDRRSREEIDAEIVARRRAWQRARSRNEDVAQGALAVIAEAVRQELGLTPHREQVIGALGLERGWLVEMATGEGKTLTLAMAAVLAAWTGRACHVLTANDYLAERDARTLAAFFARCGVTVGAVVGGTNVSERRRRYEAQVVYTTSRELVGDFLRDRLKLGGRISPESWRPWVRRQGGRGPAVLVNRIHTVFVDEADQVLVDDAVTPLIISAPNENGLLGELCQQALEETRGLRAGEDYEVELHSRRVRVAAHVTDARTTAGRHPLLTVPRWREEWIGKALTALHVYERGRHYFVRDSRVVLIDEATGRPMPERTLGEGMHTMLEAKEGLPITPPSGTVASLSFQRFFRQVPQLAGMTGTAAEAAAEFWRLYRLPVLSVPTHRPVLRRQLPLRGFANEEEKWAYVVEAAKQAQEAGQPVLIGTRTVAASEALATKLRAAGVSFALLSAVRNENEAQIIAAAGQAGQVTIATNMAGRGTDIVPSSAALEKGGLRVIATESHRSKRVDRQLHGRAGRQGQPGVVEPLACWDDEILRHHLPRWWRELGRNKLGGGWCLRWSLTFAQWRAGRWDARRRLAVLRQDQWLDENLSLGAGNSGKGRRSAPRAAKKVTA